ncbi:MAG: DUF350 domain-containing protein [Candidatus Altiarchaeum hamiconexum]|uniref:DUF350 domain-containing protein n=1 Tax=Candidatus Altarchaeum hamiconexum TaxID=1803513 RepID=A0A8J7YWN0_9ARCH|nr:DUF350 domain-containing protein [Candidatus Altarchaeum hamiconexum]OIQ04989.1 MAG: hypothetical protein AUK59_05605 [Candidatus Altarchaeum sp. CG2_30_32_3053]PIN67529.1 MAG: hypothetical protein COV98_02515 [Candidatus Altarchaeum sp. CG12_big_fil_rev_8_21_14_0_65_33_22]PIX49441.1 MAG: hypothetical protein COZ53_00615 [Candidatus Altarchaeum sp. CG_4_8_14_3_um_filter_33_2054]PIZ32079.1 MAG: hypothetical protein COY41_01725 [Candidatus Altarchaeum sp. CG_4_10_14_0_8_um_filter_32_851]PJC13
MGIEQAVSAIGLGLLQLVVGLVLAIGCIYIGFILFEKILKEIDLQEELKRGNIAIGIVMVAIVITLAGIISRGVSGITSGISDISGMNVMDILLNVVAGIVHLIIGIVLAVVAIYMAFGIWGKITAKIEETSELKNNNTAIGVVMAGVLIAVGFVIQGSVSGIGAAIASWSVVGIGGIVIGLLQLAVGLILAMACIYIGFSLFNKLLTEIDLQDELNKGNTAIGIVSAAIMITLSEVIGGAVGGITSGLFGQNINFIGAIVGGIVQLIVGIVFAVIAIYIAFRIWDKITAKIEETNELKNNNIAVGVVMAGVLIAVGFVIRGAIGGIGVGIAAAF